MIEGTRHTVTTADAVPLAVSAFAERESKRASVAVVMCAIGAPQERYAAFARGLAADGWVAVTFDYRGIAGSELANERRPLASIRAWGEHDLTAVIEWAAQRFAPRRLVVVGHSIGGQILPFSPAHRKIDAALLVSAQRGYWRLWSGWERYGVLFFFRVYVPLCLKLWGRVPLAAVGLRDLPRGVAEDYARWGLHPEYRWPDGHSRSSSFAACTFPLLALSFADDTAYAPRRAVDSLLRDYYTAPAWRCHIEPGRSGLPSLGHSGFFDPARCPPSWWREASGWLASGSLAPVPPGRRGDDGVPTLSSLAVPVTRPRGAATGAGDLAVGRSA